MRQVSMSAGVLTIDGKKTFLLSADYPYYRDKQENWPDRLAKLKAAGISIITFYIPWRHHTLRAADGEWQFDFDGASSGSRDVKHFIELCRDMGLLVIVKPGPFVHAELNYGGLPEFVNPAGNGRTEFMLDHAGKERLWHNPLPAPLQAEFAAMVREWFAAVDRELIRPNLPPDGNVIAIQIMNEGIYSDGQRSPADYDYSASSLEFYRRFLRTKYQTISRFNEANNADCESFAEIDPPREWICPTSLAGLRQYMDWSEYQAVYMGKLFSEYGRSLSQLVPRLTNMNPPLSEPGGTDYWLTRVVPERWDDVAYGHTNWIGAVSHDDSAFHRYLTLIKRAHGPNLEENWGFSHIYDSRYQYPAIPFYQTLLAVAAGATGFNVYTGVGAAHWDDDLDRLHPKPYPDCSPITHTGELTDKYRALQLLTGYIRQFGEEILESAEDQSVAYGLYLPYAHIAAWIPHAPGDAWEFGSRRALNPPRCGYKGLDGFQVNMRSENRDFGMVNLQTATLETLLEHSAIVIVGGFFMERSVQVKLKDYVMGGGQLIMAGDIPEYDEDFSPCRILSDEVFAHTLTVQARPAAYRATRPEMKGAAYYLAANPFEAEQPRSEAFMRILRQATGEYGIVCNDPRTQAWHRRHPIRDISHVFVFSRSDEVMWHTANLGTGSIGKPASRRRLRIKLPARGCAVVRIENGRLSAYLAKGVNECDRSRTAVEVELDTDLGQDVHRNQSPGDVLAIGLRP